MSNSFLSKLSIYCTNLPGRDKQKDCLLFASYEIAPRRSKMAIALTQPARLAMLRAAGVP